MIGLCVSVHTWAKVEYFESCAHFVLKESMNRIRARKKEKQETINQRQISSYWRVKIWKRSHCANLVCLRLVSNQPHRHFCLSLNTFAYMYVCVGLYACNVSTVDTIFVLDTRRILTWPFEKLLNVLWIVWIYQWHTYNYSISEWLSNESPEKVERLCRRCLQSTTIQNGWKKCTSYIQRNRYRN